ncbi:MAG: MBL fold metallo-hydrolase [Cellulosilyticum sp.]|nr:MBL fold metallo-hydrolase [Cellulosilyticum sp.]
MKIVALVENQGDKPLKSEHGLAVYIEYRNKRYLLDAGSSTLFLENAKHLKVDLSRIDAGILSHAHYDHSGGYAGFFEVNQRAPIYIRDQAKEPTYTKFGWIKKYIGIPQMILKQYSNRFTYIEGDYKLDEGVWLIPHKTSDLALRGKKMHMARKVAGKFVDDDFAHEQSLVFECRNGLVIFNSCSHGGVDNILEEIKCTFPGKKLLAMIGGFHLMGVGGVKTMAARPEEIRDLASRIQASGVKEIYTGHCTGEPAFKILKEELGEQIGYFSTGTILEYEEE